VLAFWPQDFFMVRLSPKPLLKPAREFFVFTSAYPEASLLSSFSQILQHSERLKNAMINP
jgi:hypothetical protein